MRAISAKLNTYVRSISIVNNNIEKLILNAIFWTFAALLLFYIISLGNMVVNIIERKSVEADIRNIGSEVRSLELTYLSMSNSVDINLSRSLGFIEAKQTFSIPTSKSLGFNQNVPSRDIKVAQNDL